MESWELMMVVLVAVVVGAVLPVLGVTFATLGTVRRELKDTAGHVKAILSSTNSIVTRVETASRGLEGSQDKVAKLVSSISDLSATMDRMMSSMRTATAVGSAVGPAVVAFVRGLQNADPRERERQGALPRRSSSLNDEEGVPVSTDDGGGDGRSLEGS